MAKEKKKEVRYDFSSTDLLVYIWNKKVPLLIISIVTFIASALISLTIEERYKSTAILFPSTNTSVSQNLLSGNWNRRYIYELGYDEEAEQLMQVLHSDDVRDRIIEKFNLMEHYEIKPNAKYPKTELYNAYSSNISFNLTEFLSVKIEVIDKDPVMAAAIANEIVDLADKVYNRMIGRVAKEGVVLVKEELSDARDELMLLNDSLDIIRSLGVNDIGPQTERLYEALGKAILDGNSYAQREIEKRIEKITKYGGKYTILNNLIHNQILKITELEQRYEEAKFEVEQNVPRKFVVDEAKVAEKKSYPKRSVIVIISTISALLLALIILILIDNLKSRRTS